MSDASCTIDRPLASKRSEEPPTPAMVIDALDDVRRRIRAHAGDIEVLSISAEGEVTLAFTGACTACPSQAMTIGAAVLPVVERIEGVRSVTVQGMTVSTAAMRRIRSMFA